MPKRVTFPDTDALFANAMNEKMAELGLTLHDMHIRSDRSQEQCRKYSRGLTLPDDVMLKVLCTILEMDFEDAKALVVQDDIRRNYGTTPERVVGKNTKTVTLERIAAQLDKTQIALLEDMARTLRKQGQQANHGLRKRH